jgi:hypothetical protein
MENKMNKYRVLWDSQKERDHQKDLDVGLDVRNIGGGGHPARDKAQCRAFVKMLINFRVP